MSSFIVGDCKLSCLESLFVGSKPMVALSLMELPGNLGHLVLAMGGLDNKIHLYCGDRTGEVCGAHAYIFSFYSILFCKTFSYFLKWICFLSLLFSSLFVLVI